MWGVNKNIGKKVAFLLDGYGNRRHYLQLLALSEAGFDPKVITFKEAKEGYLLTKGLAEKYSIILPFVRQNIMKTFSLKCALCLLRLMREEGICAVLTHRYKLLRYLWFCKLFYPELKIIFHMVIGEAIKGGHQSLFFKCFKKYIDKILVNSEALKKELLKRELAKDEEIEVFYSGIDISEFDLNITKEEARRLFKFPEKGFFFGMVAQFRKEKDHKGLIKAFRVLKNQGYTSKLILVGDGPKLKESQELVQKFNLDRDILFVGRLEPTKVPLFLKTLDVFVYSTFREGMPMAVLEAMASGLPIIATDAEGIPDIFNTSLTFGIILPKGNYQVLAEAMKKLLSLSEEERTFWGTQAKLRIKEAFSAESLQKRTVELFKKLFTS